VVGVYNNSKTTVLCEWFVWERTPHERTCLSVYDFSDCLLLLLSISVFLLFSFSVLTLF